MGGAAVDEPWGEGLAGEYAAPVIEAGEEVRGDGLAGFDFDGWEGIRGGFDESVDFVAFLVAEEMKSGFDASVGLSFEHFGNDPVFKKGSAVWMCGDGGGVADSDKPRGEARIAEVEFRVLDIENLPHIPFQIESPGFGIGWGGVGGWNGSCRQHHVDSEDVHGQFFISRRGITPDGEFCSSLGNGVS